MCESEREREREREEACVRETERCGTRGTVVTPHQTFHLHESFQKDAQSCAPRCRSMTSWGGASSLELLPRFFEFLSLEHANNNVHNIQLCNAVIAAGALSAQELTAMAVADKVGHPALKWHLSYCDFTI